MNSHIVFCCKGCDKPIIRDSIDHDHCRYDENNEDDWYCVDCPIPSDDEEEPCGRPDARALFAKCLFFLKNEPAAYEEFYNDYGGCPDGFIGTKERYWFLMYLKDTPFSKGEIDLAGWNSLDECKHAKKAYIK